MKKWTEAELVIVNISETANGKNDNKFEGIDGVDATGEYNKYINQNGTGLFTPSTTEGETVGDIVNSKS